MNGLHDPVELIFLSILFLPLISEFYIIGSSYCSFVNLSFKVAFVNLFSAYNTM